jgi:hypothetical protein
MAKYPGGYGKKFLIVASGLLLVIPNISQAYVTVRHVPQSVAHRFRQHNDAQIRPSGSCNAAPPLDCRLSAENSIRPSRTTKADEL